MEVPIPDDWEQVLEGNSEEGDMFYDMFKDDWEADAFLSGEPVSGFLAVIRKTEEPSSKK